MKAKQTPLGLTPKELEEKADQLGGEYEELSKVLKSQSDQRTVYVDTIKTLAKNQGTEVGAMMVIYGKEYVVGFRQNKDSIQIDPEKLERLLPIKQYPTLYRAIDLKRVEAAIKGGLLPNGVKILEKAKVTKPGSEVVVVQKKDKFLESLKQDSE